MRHGRSLPLGRDVGVLILLVILSVGVVILDRIGEDGAPAGLLSRAFFPFTRLSSHIMNLSSVHNENLILRSNLMKASNVNAALREQVHETARLRRLLDFGESHRERLRCCRVAHQFEARMGGGIVLDRGSDEEMERNMTVISPDGLVGRVVKVRSDAVLVKRLIDPGYRVSALTQRTRGNGILGMGDRGQLVMEWVSPNAEVAVGDTVITSGLGSITPKGIPIGEVTAVHDRPASFSVSLEVEPFVDFRRLEEVFVIMGLPPDYRTRFEEGTEGGTEEAAERVAGDGARDGTGEGARGGAGER